VIEFKFLPPREKQMQQGLLGVVRKGKQYGGMGIIGRNLIGKYGRGFEGFDVWEYGLGFGISCMGFEV